MRPEALPGYPFSPEMIGLMAEWKENALVVGAGAFAPVPSRVWMRFKALAGRLTARDRENLNLPRIIGASKPRWVRDGDGHLAVAKNGAFRGLSTAVRERVAYDIGHYLVLPVHPVQVWLHQDRRGDPVYDVVSLKVFPDTHPPPSENMLCADASLAKMAVLDQLIGNEDRSHYQIIVSTMRSATNPDKAYIDHGFSYRGGPEVVVPLNARKMHPETRAIEYAFSETVARHLREQIATSPEVEAVIRRAEEMPDGIIHRAIYSLPGDIFPGSDAPDAMYDLARRRRDRVRPMLYEAASVG